MCGPGCPRGKRHDTCDMRHAIMSRSETSTRPLLDTIILTLTTYCTDDKSGHKKKYKEGVSCPIGPNMITSVSTKDYAEKVPYCTLYRHIY